MRYKIYNTTRFSIVIFKNQKPYSIIIPFLFNFGKKAMFFTVMHKSYVQHNDFLVLIVRNDHKTLPSFDPNRTNH